MISSIAPPLHSLAYDEPLLSIYKTTEGGRGLSSGREAQSPVFFDPMASPYCVMVSGCRVDGVGV